MHVIFRIPLILFDLHFRSNSDSLAVTQLAKRRQSGVRAKVQTDWALSAWINPGEADQKESVAVKYAMIGMLALMIEAIVYCSPHFLFDAFELSSKRKKNCYALITCWWQNVERGPGKHNFGHGLDKINELDPTMSRQFDTAMKGRWLICLNSWLSPSVKKKNSPDTYCQRADRRSV